MSWKLVLGVYALLIFVIVAPFATAAPKKITIGLSMAEMSEFLSVMTDASVQRAKELGVELIVANAQGNIEKQINDVEDFITRKVDAIMLNAIDVVGLNDTVDKVAKSSIPLVEVNTMTANQNFTVYSGSQNIDAGRLQGEYLRKLLGGDHAKGNILILEGIMGHAAQVERNEGLYEKLINYPGSRVKVLVEVPVEHWSREGAMAKMQDYLRIFPNIDAVASVSDQMSLGAIQAIEEAGRHGIYVAGVDAMPDALQAIKDGKMTCTIFQDANSQGRNALEAAVKLARKEKVDKFVWVPFVLVTADNVNTFMGRNK
jgi:ABC-type sugar transport system substrate-binding protein